MTAVFIGSTLSSSIPDRYIRPVIAFVILASGLKYVGLSTSALGWSLVGVLMAGAAFVAYELRSGARAEAAAPTAPELERVGSTPVGRPDRAPAA